MGWKETNVNEQVGKDGGPIDAKRKMIVEQAVTNDVLDMGLLQQTAEPARQILEVETIDVAADKGYFKSEDITSRASAAVSATIAMCPYSVPANGVGPHTSALTASAAALVLPKPRPANNSHVSQFPAGRS